MGANDELPSFHESGVSNDENNLFFQQIKEKKQVFREIWWKIEASLNLERNEFGTFLKGFDKCFRDRLRIVAFNISWVKMGFLLKVGRLL